MKRHPFEFHKLELPKQISEEYQSTNDKVDNDIFMDFHKTPYIQQSKPFPYGYLILFTIIGLMAGFYAHEWRDYWIKSIKKHQNSENQSIISQKTVKVPANELDSTQKIIAKKPVYFNYYDSIIFLNDVKGSKIVVSKGFDEYIKKDKLIVKSDGYYYNIFCKDLYSNYSVGDSIP